MGSGGVDIPPLGTLEPKAETACWGGGIIQKTPAVDGGGGWLVMTTKVYRNAEQRHSSSSGEDTWSGRLPLPLPAPLAALGGTAFVLHVPYPSRGEWTGGKQDTQASPSTGRPEAHHVLSLMTLL